MRIEVIKVCARPGGKRSDAAEHVALPKVRKRVGCTDLHGFARVGKTPVQIRPVMREATRFMLAPTTG